MADQGKLIVHNPHNGESLALTKPLRYHLLLSFKDFLVESFSNYILSSHEDIFLLTSFGIKLDFQMVNEMTDIYVFDKRLFSRDHDSSLVQRYLQKSDLHPSSKPPSFSIQDPGSNIRNLSGALKAFESWSNELSSNAASIESQISTTISHINVIFKSLNIIFQFATNFISGIEKQFRNQLAFVSLLKEKSLHASWETFYQQLKKFPKIKLQHANAHQAIQLADFLSQTSLQKSAEYAAANLPSIVESFSQLSSDLDDINTEKILVDGNIELLRKESISNFRESEATKSSEAREIELLLNRSRTELLGLKNSADNMKGVYLRLNVVASELYSRCSSLFELSMSLNQFKHKLVHSSLPIFEKIASLQMRMVRLRADMKALVHDGSDADAEAKNSKGESTLSRIKDAEDFLSMVVDLPLLFGFVLIENRRQFEWYDFYSKGVVSNMSEQLTSIIEHEKSFQSLWLKKFGSLLKILKPESNLRIQLPTIDVTLVNADQSKRSQSIVCQILSELDVTREDIASYINTLKESNIANHRKFATLLERNFRDLVISTKDLKQITKVVSSLGSLSTSGSETNTKLKLLKNSTLKVTDFDKDEDLNLMSGLRSRISKLEGLLHQQQYKNLSNWPVVKPSTEKPLESQGSLLAHPTTSDGRRSTSSPQANETTSLLQLRKPPLRVLSTGSMSSRVLDASATIDKHVDNIRLRKENTELSSRNSMLELENSSLKAALDKLSNEKRQQEIETQRVKDDYESRLDIAHQTIEDLGLRHEAEVSLLKEELAQEKEERVQEKNKQEQNLHDLEQRFREEESKRENEKGNESVAQNELKAQIESMREEYNEVQEIKNELISNMHAKEADFVTERNNLEADLKELKDKIAEKNEDYEHLVEIIQAKEHKLDSLISKLNTAIKGLFWACDALIIANYDYFREFCYVLESMGLLLVKEKDSKSNGKEEYKIRRVKGLRSKKGDAGDLEDNNSNPDSKLHSTVVQDITRSMSWMHTVKEKLQQFGSHGEHEEVEESTGSADDDKFEEEAKYLISIYDEFFKSDEKNTNSGLSKCAQFLKLITFKEDVQLQWQDTDLEIVNQRFFLNGVSKRFKDVEGFAKKLTKENKIKTQELAVKSSKDGSNKISVSKFTEGDLALFLPTKMDNFTEFEAMPWTAFNIDAPNYFLEKSDQYNVAGKEWLVLRIASVTKHVVTPENVTDEEQNPFKLSIGITWYNVVAQ